MAVHAAAIYEQLPARAQSIGRLRHAVAEFAGGSGASAPQCADIAVAVSEALSNAVVHAYIGHDQPGFMAVEAQMNARGLQVVVRDEGSGLRPRLDSPGVGLGLPMIARLTEHFHISDAMPGTCVHMTFAIG